MKANSAQVEKLVAIVEGLIKSEPVEFNGIRYAARPLQFYAVQLGVSEKTIQRLTGKAPFDKRVRKVDGKLVKLLRIGTPAPPDANDYRRIMATIWTKWQFNPPSWAEPKKVDMHVKAQAVSLRDGSCFWYLAQDLTGEVAVALFKFAIASQENWQAVAASCKLAAEGRPGYKPRYWDYPNIPYLRSFYRAALHAYVTALEAKKADPPKGWEFLGEPNPPPAVLGLSAFILNLTDPMVAWIDAETEKKREAKLKSVLSAVADWLALPDAA